MAIAERKEENFGEKASPQVRSFLKPAHFFYMNTSSNCQAILAPDQQQHQRLRQEILKHAPAKKIFFLGHAQTYTRTATLFTKCTADKAVTEHYYLLVLIERSSESTLSETQDKLENNLRHFVSSTVMVQYLEEFFHWIEEGHYFANAVIQKATLLYEDDETPIPLPNPPNEDERRKANEELHKQTLIKVESFLSGAELYRLRKEYKFAAFMLHQAAEQSLRAMLMITIGLRVISHNIDKMLRYASMVFCEAAEVFSKERARDKQLLKLLNNAYLDARYREENYQVSSEEVMVLSEKVKVIKTVFENCQHRS